MHVRDEALVTKHSRALDETSEKLQLMQVELEEEKQRAEALLCEVLPPSVARILTEGSQVMPGIVEC